jgi:hypothetical protein
LSGELICCELTAVVSFIPCFYFLFLTVVAAAIIGLFNIPRSQKVHQDLSPGVERNVTATKREPRLFMFVLKQNTDRLQRKQPTPLRFPPKKHTRKKADTTNQGRALTAATRMSRVGPKRPGRAHCNR